MKIHHIPVPSIFRWKLAVSPQGGYIPSTSYHRPPGGQPVPLRRQRWVDHKGHWSWNRCLVFFGKDHFFFKAPCRVSTPTLLKNAFFRVSWWFQECFFSFLSEFPQNVEIFFISLRIYSIGLKPQLDVFFPVFDSCSFWMRDWEQIFWRGLSV